MEEPHITELRDRATDCLRELFRRAKEEDDWRANGALYYIEGWFGVLMRDMKHRKEAGK